MIRKSDNAISGKRNRNSEAQAAVSNSKLNGPDRLLMSKATVRPVMSGNQNAGTGRKLKVLIDRSITAVQQVIANLIAPAHRVQADKDYYYRRQKGGKSRENGIGYESRSHFFCGRYRDELDLSLVAGL